MKIRSIRTTGILLALLVALALLLGDDAARAQTATALVSNISQPYSDEAVLDRSDYAQAFTTGSHSNGYTLDSVEVKLAAVGTDLAVPIVKLVSGTAAHSGTATTLTGPSSLDAQTRKNYTFTAPANTTLAASTTYWILVEVASSGGDNVSWSRTESGNEDTSETGWSIGDDLLFRAKDLTSSFTGTTSKPGLLTINGYVTPVTLVSNLGKTATDDFLLKDHDYAQSFTTGGNAEGYWLSGIAVSLGTIAGHLNPPTMTLHSGSGTGTKVADLNAPATLTAGTQNYTYTPTTSVVLSASTEYWVVIEVGSSGAVNWKPTAADSEDSGAASGWSIGNVPPTVALTTVLEAFRFFQADWRASSASGARRSTRSRPR